MTLLIYKYQGQSIQAEYSLLRIPAARNPEKMTSDLTKEHKKTVERWIGDGPVDFVRLYSLSNDGCDASVFHRKCDNMGPTATVLFNATGSVYGGYISKNWNSVGATLKDTSAFLFQLELGGVGQLQKFPIQTPDSAFVCNSTNGPTFGSGPDLLTFTGTVAKSGNVFPLNGSAAPGTSYDMKGVTPSSWNNATMEVTDLVVYAVKVNELSDEWRKTPTWTRELLENLTVEVSNFVPPKPLDMNQFNILLVGPVGAGKSSFVNNVTSSYRDYVTSQAGSGSAEHSLTSMFRMYQIRTSTTGLPLNFRLCDTRGIEEGQGIDVTEMNYILDGNMPDGYQFNPSVPFSPDIPTFVKSSGNGDKMHCVCFVIDSSAVDVLSEKVLERIKAFQAKVNFKGLPQVVLLTKIDRICPRVEADLSTVYRSQNVKNMVDRISQVLGIPRGHVLPMKNYESETELDDNVNILTLLALRQILRSCQDYAFNIIDMTQTRSHKGPKE